MAALFPASVALRAGGWLALVLASLGCGQLLGLGDFEDGTSTTGGSIATGGSGGAGGAGGSGGQGAQAGAGGQVLAPYLAWLGHLRGTGVDVAWSLDMDPNGELGLCGSYQNDLSYEIGGTATAALQGAALYDAYVLKLEDTGQPKWFRAFGGSGEDSCGAIAFDAQAHVHIAGRVQGVASFDNETIDGGAAPTVYLSHLNGSGVVQRAWQLEPGGTQEVWMTDAVGDGTQWITGSFHPSITFGTHKLDTALGVRAGYGASVTLAGGKQLATIGAGGDSDQEAQHSYAIHVKSAEEVFVGGRNTGTLSGPDTEAKSQTTAGNPFVAELSSSGHIKRVIGFRGTGQSQTHDIASLQSGELVVVGLYTYDLQIGAAQLSSNNADYEGFVAKLAPDWSTKWAIDIKALGSQDARAVALDAAGNIYVTINFAGTIEVGGDTIPAMGQTDGLLLALDPDGNHRFHVWLASNGEVFLSDITVDQAGQRVVVAGLFSQQLSVRFAGTELDSLVPADPEAEGVVAAFDVY